MYMNTQFLFLLHLGSCSPTDHSQAIPAYPQGLNEQWISFLQILLNVCVHKLYGIYQNYQNQFEKFMLVYLLDIYKVGTLLIHFHANRTASQQNTSPYIILWVKLGAYPSSARTIISHHALCITRELCWIQFSCIYYCKLTRVSGSISWHIYIYIYIIYITHITIFQ